MRGSHESVHLVYVCWNYELLLILQRFLWMGQHNVFLLMCTCSLRIWWYCNTIYIVHYTYMNVYICKMDPKCTKYFTCVRDSKFMTKACEPLNATAADTSYFSSAYACASLKCNDVSFHNWRDAFLACTIFWLSKIDQHFLNPEFGTFLDQTKRHNTGFDMDTAIIWCTNNTLFVTVTAVSHSKGQCLASWRQTLTVTSGVFFRKRRKIGYIFILWLDPQTPLHFPF